jgi:hypothetical protein
MLTDISPYAGTSPAMRKASLEIGRVYDTSNSRPRRNNSFFGIYTGDELRDRVVAFLRKIYANKPADNAAADIGLPPDTVKKWFAQQNSPNGLAVIRLVGAYGPELLCAIMKDPPDWLDETKRDRERAALREQQARIAKRLEQLS